MELARPGVPEQVHLARAWAAGPSVTAFASPVTIRRNLGIGRTFVLRVAEEVERDRGRGEDVAEVAVLPAAWTVGVMADVADVSQHGPEVGRQVSPLAGRAAPARDVSVELPSVEVLPT